MTKWPKSIPFFLPKRLKTRPFGATHTYIAHIREYTSGIEIQLRDFFLCLMVCSVFTRSRTIQWTHWKKNQLQSLQRKPRHPWLVFTRVLYPGRIGIWRCWFLWWEGNRKTRRKTLEARREPTTNSTYKSGTGRALQSLSHPCSLSLDTTCTYTVSDWLEVISITVGTKLFANWY